jgi:hypothetical protein
MNDSLGIIKNTEILSSGSVICRAGVHCRAKTGHASARSEAAQWAHISRHAPASSRTPRDGSRASTGIHVYERKRGEGRH